MAKPKPTKMLAVLGRSRRTGRWRLASRSSVLSVLGSCYLDMTNSFVDDKEKLKMTVTVFLGSATFILPDGAEVRPSGTAVIAASMVDVPDHDDTSDLPTLDIEWTCLFGRIRILSEDAAGKLEADRRQKRLEKAIKKGKAAPVIETTATEVKSPEQVAPAVTANVAQPKVESAKEPVVAGVGFEDIPAADDVAAAVEDEPVVAGVGFEDIPAADDVVDAVEDEPVVAGVGFEDIPAADDVVDAVEDEPVVAGVGFEDIPAADDVAAVDDVVDAVEDEPVVAGVGFEDIPAAEAEPVPEDAAEVGEQASAEVAGEAPEDGVEDAAPSRPSADVGFVDMEYDPDVANATANATA